MYLADSRLRAILPQLDIRTRPGMVPFEAASQIQPASIDLRLDSVFWTPKKAVWLPWRRRHLDLTTPSGEGSREAHRRKWRREDAASGRTFSVPPGGLVLARTLEQVTIPNSFAAKLEGRSSLARLGLSVHCTADFLNPGFSGHIALQLVNHNSVAIRVKPGLAICQLVIVPLRGVASRVYGDPALRSKYVNDDGGPSRWWQEAQKRVDDIFGKIAEPISTQLRKFAERLEPDQLDRLERYVSRRRTQHLDAESLVRDFGARERRKRWVSTWARRGVKSTLGVMIGASVGALFSDSYGSLHHVAWGFTGAVVLAQLLAAWKPQRNYVTQAQIEMTNAEIKQPEPSVALSDRPLRLKRDAKPKKGQ